MEYIVSKCDEIYSIVFYFPGLATFDKIDKLDFAFAIFTTDTQHHNTVISFASSQNARKLRWIDNNVVLCYSFTYL